MIVARKTNKRTWLRLCAYAVLGVAIAFYGLVICSLLLLRVINPPTTALQTERRVQALMRHTVYKKSYSFVPLRDVSINLQHAVVAAEDARFFQHHGFDWKEVQIAIDEDTEHGKRRGASTITQQLVKNLFLGTSRSFFRKGIEFTIVPITEGLLSKQRILELYLNVIEWGPGIYGAEAASRHYYGVPAKRVTRDEGVQLAAVLPAPLRWKPGRMTEYGGHISERMAQMHW